MNKRRMIRYNSDSLGESYFKYTHPSGLDIYVFPKNMSATYALFGVKYGSINNSIVVDGEHVTVPDGIAHFLEHKLFFNEDGSDSFERFSEYGADANAYTSFNKTVYLFSCTDRFEDSLGELIYFVTHPYFTEESVRAEIGIISEEIKMYDDNPGDRCFYGMLEGMYEHHSIRRNICGDVGSIKKITPELLYSCYDAYYTPENMALVVCGNVDADSVIDIADKHLAPEFSDKRSARPSRQSEDESQFVYQSYVEAEMQVSKPLFSIGYKDVNIPEDARERIKRDAVFSILNEMIFARSAELYSSLFEKNMISPAFSYGYTIAKDFAYNSVAGEADDPQSVLSEISEHIRSLKEQGLDRGEFERAKRVMYAESVKNFDSTESVANSLFAFVCEDALMLEFTDILADVTFDEVSAAFENAFDERTVTLSVVLPKKN